MAITLACTTISVRPHLLTLALIVLWTDRLFAASRDHRAPHFGLLFIPHSLANLHAAFTVGFVIAFFASSTSWSGRASPRRTPSPFGSASSPCAGRLADPSLFLAGDDGHLLGGGVQRGPAGDQRMAALQRPDHAVAARRTSPADLRDDGDWLPLGLAKALLIVVLLHLFLTHVRYAFFLFPVLPILLAPELARQFPQTSAEHWRTQPRDGLEKAASARFGLVRAGFLAVLLLIAGVHAAVLRTAPPESTILTKALGHVKSHGITGKVFNSYNFGGTLIFNGIATFIDGRTDQLFLDGFVSKFALGPGNESDLAAALRQYDVRWTLLLTDDSRVAVMDKMPGWKRVYADEHAVIHQIEDKPAP